MAKIKGVIFDKDGTLLDFQKTWTSWIEDFLGKIRDMHPNIDQDLVEQVAELLGYDLISKRFYPDSVVIADTPEAGIQKIKPILPMCKFSNLLVLSEEASLKSVPVEIVPLKELLLNLAWQGIILGVVTNDSEESANTHLESIGVSGFFKQIIGYDSGFGSKPNPNPCLAFCSKMGIQANECVMVGDSLHDMHAGKLAGMKTVGVLSGLSDEMTLKPKADAILPDVSFLPELIDLIEP